MIILYRDATLDPAVSRAQPYSDALAGPEHAYVDLKGAPELTETTLVDFLPWREYDFTKTFYRLVKNMNACGGRFETNDAAFGGLSANDNLQYSELPVVARGRLMIFFREPSQNTTASWETFEHNLRALLSSGTSIPAIIGIGHAPIYFKDSGKHAMQLLLHFWVWGSTEADTMQNMERAFAELDGAMAELSAELVSA